MAEDVLRCYPLVDPGRMHVIHNGIDTDEYEPSTEKWVLAEYGIDPDRPIVIFVGRITRQKGLPYLLKAAHSFDPEAQVAVLASAADTPEIADRGRARHRRTAGDQRDGVFWIRRMLPKARTHPAVLRGDRFRLPVDLRADGHRQPRGDGLRDGRRGDPHRRHP